MDGTMRDKNISETYSVKFQALGWEIWQVAGILRDKTMYDKLMYDPMMIIKITPFID